MSARHRDSRPRRRFRRRLHVEPLEPRLMLSASVCDADDLGQFSCYLNDSVASATNLGTLASAHLRPNRTIYPSQDVDHYRFATVATGRAGQGVGISTSNLDGVVFVLGSWVYVQGNARLELLRLNSNGSTTLIDWDETGVTASGSATVSLEGQPPGTYLARIRDVSGFHLTGSYGLAIAPPGAVAADEFDTPPLSNNAPGSSTILGPIVGDVVREGLTIHSSSDVDWYTFHVPNVLQVGQNVTPRSVAIDYGNSTGGPLGLRLHRPAPAGGLELIGWSFSQSGSEQILLPQGLGPGSYYVEVFGMSGHTNGYTLEIDVIEPDRFETNDFLYTGLFTDFHDRWGLFTETGLTKHSAIDSDWFLVQLLRRGEAGHYIELDFSPSSSRGKVPTVVVYDASGNLVNLNAEVGAQTRLWLEGLPAGFYLVAVGDLLGLVQDSYDLTLNLPERIPDRFDQGAGNDLVSNATVLAPSFSGHVREEGLSLDILQDQDLFRFTLSTEGGPADAIRVESDRREGNLALVLYRQQADAGWRPVDFSAQPGNREFLSLNGRAAGEYLIQVTTLLNFELAPDPVTQLFFGSRVPDYSLVLDLPASLQVDPWDQQSRNDTPAEATDLAALTGQPFVVGQYGPVALSIDGPADRDFLKFAIDQAGQAGQYVRVDLNHAQGDLDLRLYSAGDPPTPLRSSATISHREEISLAGLSAGEYLVEVYGFAGATSPLYNLTIAVGGQSGDAWEDNGSPAAATELGLLTGPHRFEELSIHDGADEDWFRFAISAAGERGHSLAIGFEHLQGDLDLELYDEGGQWLATSSSLANLEVISLEGRPAGVYTARVVGHGSGDRNANPRYTLFVTAPGPDAWDFVGGSCANDDPRCNNDSHLGARSLAVANHVAHGSIHSGEDEDWYAFTLQRPGELSEFAGIDFQHRLGDLDLELYILPVASQAEPSPEPVLLRSSQSGRDGEFLGLVGLEPADYLLRVSGHEGATNPLYTLRLGVSATRATLPGGDSASSPDALERNTGNDTHATATDLRNVPVLIEQLSIVPRPGAAGDDEDWFRFQLAELGTAEHFVAVTFEHRLGDLALELHVEDGLGGVQRLFLSDDARDHERISLSGLPAGEYLARVRGAAAGIVHPNYALLLGLPQPEQRDWSEENGGNDSPAAATDLRQLAGRQAIAAGDRLLSIHDPGEGQPLDEDWFRFTLAAEGTNADFAAIAFDHGAGQGDLDLFLYRRQGLFDAQGQPLPAADRQPFRSAASVGNSETVSLAGVAAGEPLYLQVRGKANPAYALTIAAPQDRGGDPFEGPAGNDQAADAYDLRTVEGVATFSGLSLHAPGDGRPADEDWFRFTTVAPGVVGDAVAAVFNAELGDIDLQLYDASLNLLGEAKTRAGVENISLAGLPPATYLLRAWGHQGRVHPGYSLVFDAPRQIAGDWTETRRMSNSLGGTVWDDRDGSGSRDPGEAGRAGWTIFLDQNANGALDPEERFAVTDRDGRYLFHDLAAGSYRVVALSGAEQTLTTPGSWFVSLAVDQHTGAWDFGVRGGGEPPPRAGAAAAGRNETQADAVDLRLVQGTEVVSGLSLHSTADSDWFRFEMGAAGQSGHRVSIAFDHQAGDLELRLRDSGGELLDSSATIADREQITLAGRPAGVYFVEVLGTAGSHTPSYSLLLDLPFRPDAEGNYIPDSIDRLTPNDHSSLAFDLGPLGGTTAVPGLSIHSDADQDWFAFELRQAAVPGNSVRVDFDPSEGGLELAVAGPEGQVLHTAGSLGSFIEIPLERVDRGEGRLGLVAGRYTVRVTGLPGGRSPEYLLTITAPPSSEHDFSEQVEVPSAQLAPAAGDGTPQLAGQFPLTPLDLRLLELRNEMLANRNSLVNVMTGGLGGRIPGPFSPDINHMAAPLDFSGLVSPLLQNGTKLTPGLVPSTMGGYSSSQLSKALSFVGFTPQDLAQLNGGSLNLSPFGANEITGRFAGTGQQRPTAQEAIQFLPPAFREILNSSNQIANQSLSAVGLNLPMLGVLEGQGSQFNPFAPRQLLGEYLTPGRVASLVTPTKQSLEGALHQVGLDFVTLGRLNGQNAAFDPLAAPKLTGSFLSLPEPFVPTGRFLLPPALQGITPGSLEHQQLLRLGTQAPPPRPADAIKQLLTVLAIRQLSTKLSSLVSAPPAAPGAAVEDENQLTLGGLSGGALAGGAAVDEDQFQFTLARDGRPGQFATIAFDHDLGDLSLLLRDASGRTIGLSAGRSDQERISLAGLPAGTYSLVVLGPENPDYRLDVDVQPIADAGGDFAEPNTVDRQAADPRPLAYDLRGVAGEVALGPLSIHAAGDEDWFVFDTQATGRSLDGVRIEFHHAWGDLDLELYDLQDLQQPLQVADGRGDHEQVSLAGLPAGSYFVRVRGHAGATNPDYRFVLSAPPARVGVDALEPNDTRQRAAEIKASTRIDALSIHAGDRDLFRLRTLAPGTAADLIRIEYPAGDGLLEVVLLQNDGTDDPPVARTAQTDSSGGVILLEGLPAGDYLLEVRGQAADVSNVYALSVFAPLTGDAAADPSVLMFYVATGGQEARQLINDLELLASVLPPQVRLAALWDQTEVGGGVGRGFIQPDRDEQAVHTVFQPLPPAAGDPNTLTQFLDWATAATRAQRSGLFLFGRSAGLDGVLDGDDILTVGEARAALESAAAQPDLLVLDTGLTPVEIAWSLSAVTDQLVFSADAVGRTPLNYLFAVSSLLDNGGHVDAAALGSALVQGSRILHQGEPGGGDAVISISAQVVQSLTPALRAFTDAVNGAALDVADWDRLRDARDAAAARFGQDSLRDAGQFFAWAAASDLPAAVAAEAAILAGLIGQQQGDQHAGRRGTSGLSIYLPAPGSSVDVGYIAEFAEFAGAATTGWTDFVMQLATGATHRQSAGLAQDWSEGGEHPAGSFDLRRLAGPGHVFPGLSLHRADDVDWFRWRSAAEGQAEDEIRVRYDLLAADLQIQLFADPYAAPLLTSGSGEGGPQISLAGLAAGEYFVRVSGVAAAGYRLEIDAPAAPLLQDWAGGNDSPHKAHDLATIAGETVFAGLNLTGGDGGQTVKDWFRFATPRTAAGGSWQVVVQAAGTVPLTLRLIDPDGRELDAVTGTGVLAVRYPGTAATEYLLEVSSEDEVAYSLRFAPAGPSVMARHLFYNNSSFDGNSAAADPGDDAAIALDKTALLPGGTATLANYSSYSRGINGIMVDAAGLTDAQAVSVASFEFRVGNSDDPTAWAAAPEPASISVRTGAGVEGSDRVTIIWDDGAITGVWLQVTVRADAATGLAEPDVFYFGSAVGDAGNSLNDAYVDGTDFAAARDNPRSVVDPAPIDFRLDFNRDGFVDGSDLAIVRDNPTSFLSALKLIRPPAALVGAPAAAPAGGAANSPPSEQPPAAEGEAAALSRFAPAFAEAAIELWSAWRGPVTSRSLEEVPAIRAQSPQTVGPEQRAEGPLRPAAADAGTADGEPTSPRRLPHASAPAAIDFELLESIVDEIALDVYRSREPR